MNMCIVKLKKPNKPTTQDMPLKTGQYYLNSLLMHAFYYSLKQPVGMISQIYLTFFPKTSDVSCPFHRFLFCLTLMLILLLL